MEMNTVIRSEQRTVQWDRPVMEIGGMKMTKVIIVSGFLGAGKTTLIMEMLKGCLQEKKVVVIENDFGEVEIDESLLKSAEVDVENLKAGCICCSLREHFEETLEHALLQKPDYILIEPSGAAHLSEVLEVVLRLENQEKLVFGKAISVVDAKRYREYFKSYRTLLKDQVTYADLILLSHQEEVSEKELEEIMAFLRKTNDEAVISAKDWENLSGSMLLHGIRGVKTFLLEVRVESRPNMPFLRPENGRERKLHTPLFSRRKLKAVTVNCPGVYTQAELEELIDRAVEDSSQKVIRAKGIVQTEDGYVLLQYVKDELKIEPISVEGHCICFIGTDLDEEVIKSS